MNYEPSNLPKNCPKCGKPLSNEHLKVLSNAFKVEDKLKGMVSQISAQQFNCPECFEKCSK